MTVAGSTRYRTFIDDLARSESGRLLHRELDGRWPETSDQLVSIVRYALLPAGKLLRPMMTLHAAEAVGGKPADVLPAALGMEYLHVATLIHDDIIDADTVRRGRPAVQVAYGVPGAVVAGDHLIFSAFGSIVDEPGALPPGRLTAAVVALAQAGRDLCRGQMLEEQVTGDLDAAAESCSEIVRLKTGALFRVVCYIGALLGGAGPPVAAALARYGESVGMAFQVRDDVLCYTATAEQTGKPARSDLANGRPTLPLLLAYRAANGAERRELAAVLDRRGARDGDRERIGELLDRLGALAGARRQVNAYAERARAELAALPPSASVDVLAGIAYWTSEGM